MLVMLWNAFGIALREIRRNLTRAFLTVLGIIIGVAAVITMVTLGEGTTRAVEERISSLGSNLVMIFPGTGFGSRSSSAGVPNFTLGDISAIAEQVPGVAAVAPLRRATQSSIYLYNARSTPIIGTTQDFFPINKWSLAQGTFFSDEDELQGNAVCVIGSTVKQELFGTTDPLGEKIRIGKMSCEVIGVLASKGQMGRQNQDDVIIMPLTTMERRLMGRTSARSINNINISAADGIDGDALLADIISLMRQRRNLRGAQDNNFMVFDTRQMVETQTEATKLMTTLLAAVAGASLLVGGIGIMNIMLVSVTERTREIGIRLAIGARAREVLLQFLVEAITLSCSGGLIGIALGFVLCLILSPTVGVSFIFNLKINLIAFIFSAAVGIIFGFAPARRAAALDPIEALRHE